MQETQAALHSISGGFFCERMKTIGEKKEKTWDRTIQNAVINCRWR
jgi:hypothetical protein